MGMFDEVQDAFGAGFISGEDFEKGLTLKITEKPKYVKANLYPFPEDHPHAGETVRYTFEDTEGVEKSYDSTASNIKKALESAGAEVGDTVIIKREGKGMKTTFTVEKQA